MPDVQVLPKQLEFLRSEAREVIYSGAFGAGKTRALCLRIAMRAATPGSREGLCRRNMVSLKRSTLKTMLEPDGELPPVLPIGTYKYRRQDAEILIHGGGSILMFGTDEPDRLASLNLTGCAVDARSYPREGSRSSQPALWRMQSRHAVTLDGETVWACWQYSDRGEL